MDTDRDVETPILDEFAQYLNASIHPPNELSVPRCYPEAFGPSSPTRLSGKMSHHFLFIFAKKDNMTMCAIPKYLQSYFFLLKVWVFMSNILLTSLNNQISEFRIPNIYNEIFVLFFLMILRTHFEASLRFRKN